MKKILLTAVLLSIIFLGACKKDKSAPTPNPTDLEQKLAGKWNLISTLSNNNGNVITVTYTNCYQEFISNGKQFVETTYDPVTLQTTVTNRTYTIIDQTTFQLSGPSTRFIDQIDQNNLKYHINITNGYTITFTLTK